MNIKDNTGNYDKIDAPNAQAFLILAKYQLNVFNSSEEKQFWKKRFHIFFFVKILLSKNNGYKIR